MARRRKTRGKVKPRIEWDVPRSERSRGRAVARSKPKPIYTGTEGRKDFKPERDRSPRWESTKDRLTGGVKQLPKFKATVGLTRELEAALVPGRMFFLREPVQLIDETWDDSGKNMPAPLLEIHVPRTHSKNYDPEREIHMPRGGMIVYAGHEIVDALAGNRQRGATVRMDVYKFLVRDGVYVITDLALLEVHN